MVKIKILFLMLLFGCTENIFYKDSISGSDKRNISGFVYLNDGSDPEGILIWVKEINLYTFSKSAGEYSISIPEKSESIPGGGITDYVTIYYYVSNYLLDSASAYIFDGGFQPGTGDVNSEGLISDIILMKFLDIASAPIEIINTPDTAIVNLQTTLTAPPGRTASVSSWLSQDGALESFYIRSLSDPENVELLNTSVHLTTVLVSGQFVLEGFVGIDLNKSGLYEIFPYLRLNQELPDGLLRIYGSNPTNFSKKHIEIPIRQKTFQLALNKNH